MQGKTYKKQCSLSSVYPLAESDLTHSMHHLPPLFGTNKVNQDGVAAAALKFLEDLHYVTRILGRYYESFAKALFRVFSVVFFICASKILLLNRQQIGSKHEGMQCQQNFESYAWLLPKSLKIDRSKFL